MVTRAVTICGIVASLDGRRKEMESCEAYVKLSDNLYAVKKGSWVQVDIAMPLPSTSNAVPRLQAYAVAML